MPITDHGTSEYLRPMSRAGLISTVIGGLLIAACSAAPTNAPEAPAQHQPPPPAAGTSTAPVATPSPPSDTPTQVCTATFTADSVAIDGPPGTCDGGTSIDETGTELTLAGRAKLHVQLLDGAVIVAADGHRARLRPGQTETVGPYPLSITEATRTRAVLQIR